jgi:uncharacterized protein (DUF2384 family)
MRSATWPCFTSTRSLSGDTESVRHWFNTEEVDFSGMKPIELLDTASGIKEVDQLLGRIEHGVF